MKGDDIAGRLLGFVGDLPQTYVGKHVSRQLTRSSTAGGANSEEARCAESRADFAHKCNVACGSRSTGSGSSARPASRGIRNSSSSCERGTS